MEKINKYSTYSPEDTLLYNSSFLDRHFLAEVIRNGFTNRFEYRESCLREGKERGLDDVTTMALLDQQNYMVSILNRQDKMSMAASIESRVPFLDYRIVEFANALPVQHKTKRFRSKYILKEIARNYLPGNIIGRRKSGFGVPLKDWLNEPDGLGRYLDDMCDDANLSRYLDRKKTKELIAEHRNLRQDHSEFLWTAINFNLWTRELIN